MLRSAATPRSPRPAVRQALRHRRTAAIQTLCRHLATAAGGTVINTDPTATAQEALAPSGALTAFQQRRHFAALDGLRCLAILGVLFLHSPLSEPAAAVFRLFGRGFLGVDLFFVISGFLITTLLLREQARTGRISIRRFYRRRALRILPLYLLVVTALGVYFALLKGDAGAARLWPWYYGFLANTLVDHIPMLAPTWSLSVEEQYYLLWPLALILLPRRWLPWGIALFVLAYTVALGTGLGDLAWRVGPLAFTLAAFPYTAILSGSALALLLHRPRSFAGLWALLGGRQASLGLALLLLIELALLPETLLGWPLLLIHLTMAAWLGALVIREDTPLMPLLRLRPVMRIGAVSYGIYLLHLIAAHVAGIALPRLWGPVDAHPLLYVALFWGLSWAMAEVSFRLFERPFLELRHRKGELTRNG